MKAPASCATSNMRLIGPTTSEVPAATKRSQDAAAAKARSRSSSTSDCPNEIVAGFHGPPHGHAGTETPDSQARCADSRGSRRTQRRQTTAASVPCTFTSRSTGNPLRSCRPSTFWVTRRSIRPWRARSAIAACPAFGEAARIRLQVSPL